MHPPVKFNTYPEALKAIQRSSNNYVFCHLKLKENKELALMALNDNPRLLIHLPEIFKKDKEMVLNILKNYKYLQGEENFSFKNYIFPTLLNDFDIGLKLVQINDKNFKMLSQELKNNSKIVLEYLKKVHYYNVHNDIGEEIKEKIKLTGKRMRLKWQDDNNAKEILMYIVKQENNIEEKNQLMEGVVIKKKERKLL